MKKAGFLRSLLVGAGILIFCLLINSCEKSKYDLLDPATAGVFTLFDVTTGLPSNQITAISHDDENNLWVAFSGEGVGLYRDDVWTFYNSSNSGLINNVVTSLESTPDGGMMIGTADGICFRSPQGNWSSYRDPAVTIMRINAIKVTADQDVWYGTENEGFYISDGISIDQYYTTSYKNVNAIDEDNRGSIYLGTDNGLLKWNGSDWTVYTVSDGLPYNNVTALLFDSKKRMWIGTKGGQTVSWIDDRGTLRQLSLMNGDLGEYVQDIFEDRKGDIWFATMYDGLIRYDGVVCHSFKEYNGFFENDVNCIGEDGNGNLWIGLYSKGLVRYTLPLN